MARMFVPGPVDVDPEILAVQAKPMLPHRSKEFEEIFHQAADKAKSLFKTQYRVFLASASGSGMQEASIRNFVELNVLCCVNGAFSQRWYEIAAANGKKADRLDAEWGQVITPEMLADALKKKPYEAVTIVHNETSTGVENPLPELCATAQDVSPDTLILVDAVSSLGGVNIEMDAWKIDFLLTSSQKCLALPPGLALASASDRSLQKAQTVSNRGWYFDLLLMEKHRLKDSTPMTPAIPLIYALNTQLDRIFTEGLENRFARHETMSQMVQDWASQHNLGIFAAQPYRSKTVTAINNTSGIIIDDLNKYLLQQGMQIANGYGALKGKTFRIAHMGDTQPEHVQTLLTTLDSFLKT